MMTMTAILAARATLGRQMAWLMVAFGVALLGFSAAPGGAGAETGLPGTVSVSKARFMEICRQTGGAPYETGNNSVACFYPDGSMSVCNFDTMTCEDYPAIPSGSDLDLVPPSGLVAQPDDLAPPTALDAAPALSQAVVADDDRERGKAKAKKNAKGSKSKKGGKARKR